jgi:hypothetical protein
MQLYITGTIAFLVVEMIANFAYYRYINKHGGSAGSLAFLFVGEPMCRCSSCSASI